MIYSWIAKSSGQSKQTSHSLLDGRVVLCIVGLLYLLGAMLSQRRAFDQDEFLHVHSAWSIFKGLLPYRDYFDHYTPLFHFFLVPFFHFFKVESDSADAIAFFFFARKLMWFISGLILLLTFWLGKLWRNTEVGYIAILFLLSTEAYWNTTLEIRPDPLEVVFWLLYLVMVVRAVQVDRQEHVRKRMFACSGLFLALGFLTIQKVVYAFPGLAVATCWYILSASDHGTRRRRLAHVACQFVGFCIPMVFTAGYFYLHSGLAEFIRFNFLFFLGAPGFWPSSTLHEVLYQHPFLGLFGSAGLLCSLPFIFRRSSLKSGGFVIAPAALALIVGLFLIPFPLYQYYILLFPLVAVFAATFLIDSIAKLGHLRERLTDWQWTSIAALISIAILTGLVLIGRGAESHWPLFLIIGYWLGALLSCMALLFRRAPGIALIFFLVAMIVGPMKRLQSTLTSPGANPQIAEMRYIIENTAPTETIMDGFRGSGVYRPHAYFFWFIPYGVRQRLTDRDKQLLLEDLYTGSISPKLILFDPNLRDFSPASTEFFEAHYEPVGTGMIWRRKPVSRAAFSN
jgi:Dolichyl-phosphate-mannose-protein mannosyltransferase